MDITKTNRCTNKVREEESTTQFPPPPPPAPPPSSSSGPSTSNSPAHTHSLALVPFTGGFPVFPKRPPTIVKGDPPTPIPLANGDGSGHSEKKPAVAPPCDREHKKRSKNWTRSETLTLIRLRTELAPRFAKAGRKSDLWDEISDSLHRSSFSRDAQQCRDKWEKLMAGYKEVRDCVKRREDNPYFEELHPLLSERANRREREQTSGERMPSPFPSLAKRSPSPYPSAAMEPSPAASIGAREEAPRSSSADGEDEGQEDRDSVQKRRKGSEFVELQAVQTLLDRIIAGQQSYFNELLDTIEQREQRREQLRQEREERWREGERAERAVFTEAMLYLTEKLGAGMMGAPHVAAPLMAFPAPRAQPRPPPPPPPQPQPQPPPLPPSPSPPAAGSPVEHLGPKKRSKNWKRVEVLQLIKLRGEMEDKFVSSMKKTALWEELADALGARGISRDAKQCREKWDKLMSEYKDVSDGKKVKGDSPYFHELSAALAEGKPG